MSAYKAPVQEFSFILKELVGYESHSQRPGYEDVGMDMLDAVLPEAAKFFEQVIAPTNAIADSQGTHIENGEVVTAPVLDGLSGQLVEGGWNGSVSYTHLTLPTILLV